jgi:Fe2+ or Zn2+ uptake regulation protein
MEIDPRWQKNSNVYTCDCGATVHNSTYLWANQHGFAKRVFCDHCGQWTDVSYCDSEGWVLRIVHEPHARQED